MTVYEYAIYRYAARHMSLYQLKKARALAEKADAGDQLAASALRKLVDRVIRSTHVDAENDSDENESHQDERHHAA